MTDSSARISRAIDAYARKKPHASQRSLEWEEVQPRDDIGRWTSTGASTQKSEQKSSKIGSYDEFKKAYEACLKSNYEPGTIGFDEHSKRAADLADEYPEWAEKAEKEWEDAHYGPETKEKVAEKTVPNPDEPPIERQTHLFDPDSQKSLFGIFEQDIRDDKRRAQKAKAAPEASLLEKIEDDQKKTKHKPIAGQLDFYSRIERAIATYEAGNG